MDRSDRGNTLCFVPSRLWIVKADTIEFHQYAEKVIREYADDGKNVIPLIKDTQPMARTRMQMVAFLPLGFTFRNF
eukprot:826099-Amphidinium_carterae.1